MGLVALNGGSLPSIPVDFDFFEAAAYVPEPVPTDTPTPPAPTNTPTPTDTPTPTPTNTPTPTSTAAGLFLPLVLHDYVTYFVGPWEVEPNNTCAQANGPLIPGRNYFGYPNDQKDYFSVYLRSSGTLVVDLSGHTGQGVQLQLRDAAYNLITYVWQPPYHIERSMPAGWYYIYIFTESGYNNTTPYTLYSMFP